MRRKKHSAKSEPHQILADRSRLSHINTCGELPKYYVEKQFTCVDCGSREVWTARSQKWYYEVAKGHISATAIRCRPCREKPAADTR